MANDKAIDSQMFLVGRERTYDEKVMGRQTGDAERLFPLRTHATAASSGEVTINGRVLKLWEFAQLESLSVGALKQRALAIRDAIGEASCPPIPSAHSQDLVRWILHVQGTLTNRAQQEGRSGGYGTGHLVPQSFAQDTKARPIDSKEDAAPSPSKCAAGRSPDPGHQAMRDHYADLKYHRAEFEQAPNQGITSLREGGEGRRHFAQELHNAASPGQSPPPKEGQGQRENGEGRKFLGCDDHIAQQQKELEAMQQGFKPAASTRRELGGGELGHVSDTSMTYLGVSAPAEEPPIGGDRRRHASQPDHMLNSGISSVEDTRKGNGTFGGPRARFGDSQSYQSTWKKDPSRLLGTSLIC